MVWAVEYVVQDVWSVYARLWCMFINPKAQVTRDAILKTWSFKETDVPISREFGCGYPSGLQSVDQLSQLTHRQTLKPKHGFETIWMMCLGRKTRILEILNNFQVSEYCKVLLANSR